MAGSSPGTSRGAWCGDRSGGVGEACPYPCDRGCPRLECTVKFGKRITVYFKSDWVDNGFRGHLEVVEVGDDGIRREYELSYDNCLRTLSTSTEVVEVVIFCSSGAAEVLLDMCKSMNSIPSLKVVSLLDVDPSEWSVPDAEGIFSALYGAKSTLQRSSIRFSWPVKTEIAKVLVDILLQNQVLQDLELECFGNLLPAEGIPGYVDWNEVGHEGSIEEFCRYLKAPTNVLTVLGAWGLRENEMVQLVECLGDNKKLQVLHVGSIHYSLGEGMGKMGDLLRTNTVLEELYIFYSVMGGEEMKALVGALIPDATSRVQPNTHLHTLRFWGSSIEGKDGMEQLATLIRSKNSLLTLGLQNMKNFQKENENAVEFLEILLTSLQSNVSLESLQLGGNSAIEGKYMLGMIMDMLLHNRILRQITLDGTGLKREGSAEIVYAELRTRGKEIDQELEKAIRKMEHVAPNSARIFLCGDGEAGKTTLCQRWKEINERSGKDLVVKKNKHIFLPSLRFGRKRQPKEPSANAKSLEPEQVLERTHGIEVHRMIWKEMKISLWDMAGQREYHAFHDLVLPNQSAKGECCFYFVVCNPTKYWDVKEEKLSSKLEDDIGYWLRFLASNTRPSEIYRPHVTILMTHFDLWQFGNYCPLRHRLNSIVKELKQKFEGVLDFDRDPSFFMMDNRSQSLKNDIETEAAKVKRHAEVYLKQLSSRLPKLQKASIELQVQLEQWCKEHPKDYFLKWEKFSSDLCGEVEDLKPSRHIDNEGLLEKIKKHIASSLHSSGHIMYFEDIDMVIMNPHWFCNKIMGSILDNCSRLNKSYAHPTTGIISKSQFVELICDSRHASASHEVHDDEVHQVDILKIMSKLQICYEDDHDNIMIPSILNDESCSIDWSKVFSTHGGQYKYVGTSLTTQDDSITSPTQGFFPRLQVYLHGKYASNTYRIYLNVISFIWDDINVLIVYKDGSINILSRAIGDANDANHMMHKTIHSHINDFRQKPTLGCPGVIFEEHIVRPECVEHPSRGKFQSVSKKQLKEVVLRTGNVKYAHKWTADEVHGDGLNYVDELLGSEEWQDVLQSRDQMVKEMEKELDKRLLSDDDIKCQNSSMSLDDVYWDDIPSPVDPVNATLSRQHQSMKRFIEFKCNKIMEKLETLEQMVKCIIHSQEALTVRVCSNIDRLLECSLLLKNVNIPKLPYIVKAVGCRSVKQMLLKVVPGLTTCHLQFRCEHNDHGFHYVDDQPGCEIQIGNNQTRKFGTVMFWALTISAVLLKVGAHVVAPGLGSVVPDLAKEFATVLDSPGLLDLAQPKGPILNCLPVDFQENPIITLEDNEQARDWLVKLLEMKCRSKSMYDMFKLTKVQENILQYAQSHSSDYGKCSEEHYVM